MNPNNISELIDAINVLNKAGNDAVIAGEEAFNATGMTDKANIIEDVKKEMERQLNNTKGGTKTKYVNHKNTYKKRKRINKLIKTKKNKQ